MVPRLSEMQPLDEDLCEDEFPLKGSLKFAQETDSVSLIYLVIIMIITIKIIRTMILIAITNINYDNVLSFRYILFITIKIFCYQI